MAYYSFPSNPRYCLVAGENWWPNASLPHVVLMLDVVKISFELVLGSDCINSRNVTIVFDTDGPSCWPPNNIISLSASGDYWAQYAYQFSHELCHCVINFHKGNKWLWLEETICEMASIFFMNKSSELLSNAKGAIGIAPLIAFAPSMRTYTSNVLKKARPFNLKKVDSSPSPESLEATPTDRPRNAYIASLLLPIFSTYPQLWKALLILNSISAEDITGLLKAWMLESPSDCRPGIVSIAEEFGIHLES